MNLKFNRTCYKYNITPVYINVKIRSKTPTAQQIKKKAERLWLKQVIQQLYTKIDKLTLEAYNTQMHLSKILHRMEYEYVIHRTQQKTDIDIKIKRRTINNKMKRLRTQNTQNSITSLNNFPNLQTTHNFYQRIQNNTQITFTEKETTLLNKGLKYNITPVQNKNEEKKQLLQIENAIVKTQVQHRDNIRATIVQQFKKQTPKRIHEHLIEENKTIKNIKNKISLNHATITKADKGNTIVIMLTNEYNDKIDQYIQNNNIEQLQNDPTKLYKTEVNNSINKNNKIIDLTHRHHLKMIKPSAPVLRGLPKIHKDGVPMRPLINYTTAPSYKLSKHLNKYLNERLKLENSHSIKNNIELIDKIENINIPNSGKLASFDITNMYGNIPVNETLHITKRLLTSNNIDKMEVEQLMNLLNTVMSQNYFQHNEKFYRHIDGLPMGNPLSGTLAEIFMDNFEKHHVFNESNLLKNRIIYWHRYVDDVLVLFDGTQRQLKILHNHINNIHPNIKFTLEIEINNQINFLDITILKNLHKKHEFKIFRKNTQTDHTIHQSSNHPHQHKMSAYYHMITRLNNIPMSQTNYKNEINIIKYIAKMNGFNCDIIDNINRKYIHRKELRSYTTLLRIKEENKKYITVDYNTTTMNLIHKIFRQHEYNLAYRTINKIDALTKYTTTNSECESGVYKLKCNDCNAVYIGQTGRNFQLRYKEHIQEIGKNNIRSNYAQHLTKMKHTQSSYEENLCILHKMPKSEKLNRMEEIEIYRHKHNPMLLNEMIPYNQIYEYILRDI